MKVVEISEFGAPDVLKLKERPIPDLGPDEVLVRVEAAGVARADLLQRQGHYPPPAGASDIPGLDAAGVVERVGSGVTNFKPGDKVCAILAGGGYAEYCAVPQEQVLPLPDGWTTLEAATLPENLFTVFDNLVTRARLQRGETLLIHGGSSGIGTMAIMLGNLFETKTFVTAGSDAKGRACMELGAQEAINYKTSDFVTAVLEGTGGRGADVILDMVGGSYFERNLAALATDGRLVIIATQGGRMAQLDLAHFLRKRAYVMGSTMRSRTPAEKGRVAEGLLKNIWPTLPTKAFIRPLVDSVFPLAEASAAHQRLESGDSTGKVLLTVDGVRALGVSGSGI